MSTVQLGRVVATPGAMKTFDHEFLCACLTRHLRGDWGELGPEDWSQNDLAIDTGARLLSVYTDDNGQKVWLITEADRSSTCCLLPSEY